MSKPIGPREYELLLDYITQDERLDYLRLTHQLINKNITEEFFNAKHDQLFNKLDERKKECNLLFIRSLPPRIHEVMQDYEKKQYYQSVIWYKTGLISQETFNEYHEKTILDLQSRLENAEANDRIMKSLGDGDHVSIKLGGGRHSDYEDKRKFTGTFEAGDVMILNEKGFLERYKRKLKKKTDTREVSTFYDVK